jgi:hypothetical protein
VGVLAQCTALSHLDLSDNQIGPGGAGKLAGVLGQCPALELLDLSYNSIGSVGNRRLWSCCTGTLEVRVDADSDSEEEDDDAEEEEEEEDWPGSSDGGWILQQI